MGEWVALCGYEAEPNSTVVAFKAENKKKNRYPDKLPYDHNRVILNALVNASSSDYINASTVVIILIYFFYVRCLKLTEKVSFNIASEASYVHILSGQKLIKNAKNGQFWRVVRKPEACGQIVLPDRSVLIGQKLVENAKMKKFKCVILSNFQTM